jgi:hypothetical protein
LPRIVNQSKKIYNIRPCTFTPYPLFRILLFISNAELVSVARLGEREIERRERDREERER